MSLDDGRTVRFARDGAGARGVSLVRLQVALIRLVSWIGLTAIGALPFVLLALWLRRFALGGTFETASVTAILLLGMRVYARWVQPRLDRFFGGRRRDLATELESLAGRGERLQPNEELGRAVDRFLRLVDRRLAALLVVDPRGRLEVAHSAWGAVPAPSRRSGFVAQMAEAGGKFVTRQEARDSGRVELERACVRWGAEYLIPLVNGTEVVGVLAVSPKSDGRGADLVELDALDRARSIVTASIVAASLYQRSSVLSAELEQKANARSIELAKALRDLSGAEERLVRSEKLALLGQIVGGVGNDLAEQVSRIFDQVGPVRLHAPQLAQAAQDVAVGDDKQRAHFEEIARDLTPIIDAMAEGARRASTIAEELLRFAPQQEFAGAVTRERVSVDALADATLQLLGSQIGAVRVARAYGEGLPAVEMERGPIEQVILNLVLNALQAMKGRGILTLATRYEREWVELSVGDTGPGIPADVLPRIFEPFFSTKEATTGTGLGLWLSSGIVERHGGRIVVETKLGRGTTFRMRLPREST